MKIINYLQKLKILTERKHLKYIFLVFIGNQVGSFIELVGLSIIPILALYLITPEKLFTFLDSKNLTFLSDFLQGQNYLLLIIVSVVLFFILKNIFLLMMVYFQRKLGIIIRNYNTAKLYQNYLYSPYIFHTKKNPSKLIGILTLEVSQACGILEMIILILREVILILLIVIMLFLVNPQIFTLILTILLFLFFIYFFITKKYSIC